MESLIVEEQKFNKITEYHIENYDDQCEEHFKIIKIIPLKESIKTKVINVLLHIFTVCLIEFVYGWFPITEKYCKYEESSLDEATMVAIYCTDKQFYMEELKKLNLPQISNEKLLNQELYFNTKSFLFTFKLFTYIFNPKTNNFNSAKFSLHGTKEQLYDSLTKGLNPSEYKYQREIYGECNMDFKVNSFFRTLFLNTCNFFFFFQVYSIVLWICTEYYSYSAMIALMTIYSLIEETYITRKNLLNIRDMARYVIDVNVLRREETKVDLNTSVSSGDAGSSRGSLDSLISIKNYFSDISLTKTTSDTLVPGDIFEVPEDGMAMPCDCILLTGSIIINEAMLTGESTPIIKAHMPSINQIFDEDEDTKYFLFAGTKIVQKRPEHKKPVLALCYSTGFNTIKGNLVRSILFPKEISTKFQEDSNKYIIFMGVLCLVGFLILLPIKLVRVLTDEEMTKEERSSEIGEIFLELLDLVTTAVPPALPCCLEIGTSIAQDRIKKHKVLCINRDRINFAGKLSVCVFDKTGTLTEDHLDIDGFVPVTCKKNKDEEGKRDIIFDKYISSVREISEEVFDTFRQKAENNSKKSKSQILKQRFVECLSSCQGITKVKNKIIGDPVDVGMFEATEWNLEEDVDSITYTQYYNSSITSYIRPKTEKTLSEKIDNKSNLSADEIDNILKKHYELGIVRRFDFSSKLQRMSTLVKNMNEKNLILYCKGSPEKIFELCLPHTIPENFNDVLTKYTAKGFRVLALSYRLIQCDMKDAFNLNRISCEKNLIFLGLLIVKNKIKDATAPTLNLLGGEVNLRLKMATGDNILTAICVGKESNIIPQNSVVYTCEIEEVKDKDEEKESQDINTRKLSNDGTEEKSANSIIKSKFRKRLVWHTIENYEDNDNIKANGSDNNNINNSSEEVMEDTAEDDYDEDIVVDDNLSEQGESNNETGSDADTKSEGSNKSQDNGAKKKKKVSDDDDIDDVDLDIDVDLTKIPFNKNEEDKEIIIAISGKNFETLYKLNKRYLRDQKELENKSNDNVDQTNKENSGKAKLTKENVNFEMDTNAPTINQLSTFHEVFRLILKYCSIYARCSPENKAQLVKSLQDERMLVLMCGDGANDCCALKAADVGISLSTEEASMAAPFTSQIPDISCIINVLREGKCALVTSIQTFKYIILYSLIQFCSVTMTMLFDSLLSDWQYMASDIAIITPLAFFIPMTEAYEKLTYHQPVSALICFPVIVSIFLQTGTMVGFQVGSYYLADAFFPAGEDEESELSIQNQRVCSWEFEDEEGNILNCIDNTTVFYISFAQYLISAIVFCTSKPFKKKIYTNIWLTVFAIIAFIYSEYIVLYCGDKLSKNLIKLVPYPDDTWVLDEPQDFKFLMPFKFYIAIIIVLNFGVCLLLEKIVLKKLKAMWERRRIVQIEAEMKEQKDICLYLINKAKNYKVVEKRMSLDEDKDEHNAL